MSDPVGYFITWHTYGTWLRGQAPGAVDDEHNTPGEPFIDSNAARLAWERGRLQGPAIRFEPEHRAKVVQTIREVCEHKGWTLHAVHARSTHVHVVVSGDEAPQRMMNTFKSWCTRRLREATPIERIWSRHGSTRWLWNETKLAEKVEYVLNGQGKPMSRWPESPDLESNQSEPRP